MQKGKVLVCSSLFNLLSSNPVTLQRASETIVQSETIHTPWTKCLPLESEVQKEVIELDCSHQTNTSDFYFIILSSAKLFHNTLVSSLASLKRKK